MQNQIFFSQQVPEEDNIAEDSLPKYQNYKKIGKKKNIQKQLTQNPTLSKEASSGKKRKSGLKVAVSLLFFPCTLQREH